MDSRDIHLTQPNIKSHEQFQTPPHAISVNGRNYTLQGDPSKIESLMAKIPELVQTRSPEDLHAQLIQLGAKEISTVTKTSNVGIDSLYLHKSSKDEILQELMKDMQGLVPKGAAGIIGITQQGKEPVYIFNGQSSVAKGDINEHTAFLIGSGAKMFTALLVKILEQKGTLSLDSKLSDFMRCEQFALFADPTSAKEITLEMLLSHTSGLQYWADDANKARKGYSIDAILYSMKPGNVYQFATPGDKVYSYSNQIDLAAVFIEKSYKKAKAKELIAEDPSRGSQSVGNLIEEKQVMERLSNKLDIANHNLSTLHEQLIPLEASFKLTGSKELEEKIQDLEQEIRMESAEIEQLSYQLNQLKTHALEISNYTINDVLNCESSNFHGIHTFDLIDYFLSMDISYATILKTELLEPLGMGRTTFDKPEFNAASAFSNGISSNFEVHDPMTRCAGGLWSCMSDMMNLSTQLATAFHDRSALTTKSGALLITSEGVDDLSRVRGLNGKTALGIDVEGDIIGKGGSVSTFDFKFQIDQSTGNALSSMCNFAHSQMGKTFPARAVKALKELNPASDNTPIETMHEIPLISSPSHLPLSDCIQFFKGCRGYIGITETGRLSWNGQELLTNTLENGKRYIIDAPPKGGLEILFLNGHFTGANYLVTQKDNESMPFKEVSIEDPEIQEIYKAKNVNFASIKEAGGVYTSPLFAEGRGPPPFTVEINAEGTAFTIALGDSLPFPAVATEIKRTLGEISEISLVSNLEDVPDKLYKLMKTGEGWSFVISDFISKRPLEDPIPKDKKSSL